MTSPSRVWAGLFWSSVAVVGSTYVGFPVVAVLRARVRPRPVRAADVTPSVSLVIAAHNEERGLGDKLRSVLDCDYPADLLDVVVASDGSTDRTVEVAQAFAGRGVRTLDLPRAGKAATLNAAVAGCAADVVVLSDANNPLDPAALRELVKPFADPEVGGVAGDQRYAVPDLSGAVVDGTTGERSYWALDRMVKDAESLAGNVISATGALYAVRRDLFPDVVEGVTDDFWVSTAVVAAGRRLVQAPDAVVYEIPAAGAGPEFDRKVRVMTRGFRGVYERRALFDVRTYGFYSVQLLFHKLLRRLMVAPMVVAWVASVLAARGGGRWWRVLAGAQTAGYAVGVVGLRVRLPGAAAGCSPSAPTSC